MFGHNDVTANKNDSKVQLDGLVQLYLEYTVGRQITVEELVDFDTSPVSEALEFFLKEGLFTYFNIDALLSQNPRTVAEYAKSKKQLFGLLDKVLVAQRQSENTPIFNFSRSRAENVWTDAKLNLLNQSPLKAIHAKEINLGVVEKFLQRKLTPREWLSDIDLERLREIYGYKKNQIVITKCTEENIGLALHFARVSAANANLPGYQINFILNCGGEGSVLSQGSHWVRMTVTVDNQSHEVRAIYRDSIKLSNASKKSVEKIVSNALKYSEIVEENGEKKQYQALNFNNSHLRFEIDISDDGEQGQKDDDRWSCGYRAFSGLVRSGVEPEEKNARYDALLQLLRNGSPTSEKIRDIFFADMLCAVQIDKENLVGLQEIDLVSEEDSSSQQSRYRLSPEYVEELVANLSGKSHSEVIADLSLDGIRKEREINRYKQQYIEQYRDKLKIENGVLDLNFEEFIFASDSIEIAQAKIKALFYHVSKDVTIKKINFTNIYCVIDSDVNYVLRNEFDQLLTVVELSVFQDRLTAAQKAELKKYEKLVKVNLVQKTRELEDALLRVVARNQMIASINEYPLNPASTQPNLVINPEEDIWMQLWRKRLSSPTLFLDKAYTSDTLSIYSTCHGPEIKAGYDPDIDSCVSRMGAVYIEKMFEFIEKNRRFFEQRKSGFPYSRLQLGDSSSQQSAQISNEYLVALIKQFSMGVVDSQNVDEVARQRYVPFSSIALNLHKFDEHQFELLKKLLETIAMHQPGITSFEISLYADDDRELKRSCFTLDQCHELIKLFERLNVKFIFNMPELASVLENDKSIKNDERVKIKQALNALSNIAVRNMRAQQEARLMESESFDSGKKINDAEVRQARDDRNAATVSRPYKKQSFNIRSELNYDIQFEFQHQMQFQNQIEQEVQQEYQIDAQQEAIVDESDSFQSTEDDNLINRDRYIKLYRSTSSDCISSVRSPALLDILSEYSSHQSVFWNLSVAKSDFSKNIKYITRAAMTKMHSAPEYFLHGLNVDNMPAGFYLEQLDGAFVLCFDETRFIENKNESPLTLQLKKTDVFTRWHGDLNAIITDTSGLSENQVRTFCGLVEGASTIEKNATLQKLIDFMHGLDEDMARELISAHQWFFGNPEIQLTKKSIFSFIDLLYFSGCAGVGAMLASLKELYDKDRPLFDSFKSDFLDRAINIRGFVDQQSLTSIRSLADMPFSAKKWWQALSSVHMKYNEYVDLPGMHAGFQFFLKKLPAGMTLPLPVPLELDKSGQPRPINMFIYLDRLLAILSRVAPKNLIDQLENLQGLSFAQDGAWYAGRWESFRYFHPAMELRADAIDQEFEAQILGRSTPTYIVSISDLIKIADASDKIQSMSYPLTLFHRHIGRSDRIAVPYSYYVELINELSVAQVPQEHKLLLLPLLAICTTGERGSNRLDHADLLSYIRLNADEKLKQVMRRLNQVVDQWEYKPDLHEMTAILQFLYESREDTLDALVIDLQLGSDLKLFRAIAEWSKNPNHLAANLYADKLLELRAVNEADSGDFALILAKIKKSSLADQEINLAKAFLMLDSQSEKYHACLQLLTAVDIDKSKQLPELSAVVKVLERVVTDRVAIPHLFAVFSEELPGCVFDLYANRSGKALDLTGISGQIEQLNAQFTKNGLAEIDLDVLRNDESGDYFQSRMDELKDADPQLRLAMTLLAPVVYQQAITAVKEIIFFELRAQIEKQPAFADLLGPNQIFAEPALSGKYEGLGKDLVTLMRYAKDVSSALEILGQLHAKFGHHVNFEFLANSVRARQLSHQQLVSILSAVRDLDVAFFPADLLKAIFSGEKYSSSIDLNSVVASIDFLLKQNEFTLVQKNRLLGIASKSPGDMAAIVKVLKKVATDFPLFTNDSYQFVINTYDQRSHQQDVINALNDFLDNDIIPNTIKQIILKRLVATPDYLIDLIQQLDVIKDKYHKKIFIEVIGYSVLDKDDDAKVALSDFPAYLDFIREYFAPKADSNVIEWLPKLYKERPYPGLRKLQQFLSLTPDNRASFVGKFHVDPPGLRSSLLSDPKKSEDEQKKLTRAQFSRETAHTRIDQIRDLSRLGDGFDDHANYPLYYTQRKNLFNYFLYINTVGVSLPLSIPGQLETKETINTAVMNLTKKQIRLLVRHYRSIISDPQKYDLTAQQVLAAKLEFIAVIRESMYRTTGKFPYSTQIISLLNVMLQGGNVFSEIRTGEGKGCITALFSCFKWVEGNAVDVCSSNMELARRDLEEFKEFYDYLGIDTALVTAKSNMTEYRSDGINYSDMAEMALFQERMFLQQESLPERAACVLDEADFNTLDNKSQFRFAANLDAVADPHVNSNEWAYPLILRFVQREAFKNKLCSPQQDIYDLREFVQSMPDLSPIARSKFGYYPDALLDKWIDSAYIASCLIEKEDFTVQEGKYIIAGQEVDVQIAKVKINHRESKDSTFSDGVHQFLHTRLNMEIASGQRTGLKFPIEPEKTYLASRSSKNFIDYYRDKGGVLGLTGTVGSASEIAEMRKQLGFKFFRIPPHKQLMRVDHAPVVAEVSRLTKLLSSGLDADLMRTAHFKEILNQVRICQKLGQPVLVICESVDVSVMLHEFLSKKLDVSNKKRLQIYNGEQKNIREKDVVDRAGLPGMVTVTTPMLGRGTDIKPSDENGNPIPEGLFVIDTFIDPDRDFGQKIGRSGRNGARGDSKLILSMSELEKHGISAVPSESELPSVIESIRAKLNDENAEMRRIRQSFADVKDQYFFVYIGYLKSIKRTILTKFEAIHAEGGAQVWSVVERESYILWEKFLVSIDKKWKQLVTQYQHDFKNISTNEKNEALLEKQLNSLLNFANQEWASFTQSIVSSAQDRLVDELAAASQRLGLEITDELDVNMILTPFAATMPVAAPAPVESIPEQLEYTPLDQHRINIHDTYLKISGTDNLAVQERYITKELEIAYDIYFPGVNPNKKFGLKEDRSNRKEIDKKLCAAVLRKILNEYYSLAFNPKSSVSAPRLLKTVNRLMTAIGRYGDSSVKKLVFDITKSELVTYKNNTPYLSAIIQFMAAAKNMGAITEWVDIDEVIQDKSHPELDSWLIIKAKALRLLQDYLSGYGLSADRKNFVPVLIDEINKIDRDDSIDARQKISDLSNLIKRSLSVVIQSDYANDYNKMRLFNYRDLSTSKLWNRLTQINDIVSLYISNQAAAHVSSEQEIEFLKVMLQKLLERAGLEKNIGHPVINQIRSDKWLIAAINQLDQKQEIHAAKLIALIHHRLNGHANILADTAQTDAEKTFSNYLSETLRYLQKFKQNRQQVELLLPVEQRNDVNTVYTTKNKELLDYVQNTIFRLLNQTDKQQILPISHRMVEFIPGNQPLDKIARQALVEIARLLRKVNPQASSVQVIAGTLDADNDRLSAVISYRRNDIQYEVKVQVDSFSLEPRKRHLVLCQWPATTEVKIEPSDRPSGPSQT